MLTHFAGCAKERAPCPSCKAHHAVTAERLPASRATTSTSSMHSHTGRHVVRHNAPCCSVQPVCSLSHSALIRGQLWRLITTDLLQGGRMAPIANTPSYSTDNGIDGGFEGFSLRSLSLSEPSLPAAATPCNSRMGTPAPAGANVMRGQRSASSNHAFMRQADEPSEQLHMCLLPHIPVSAGELLTLVMYIR